MISIDKREDLLLHTSGKRVKLPGYTSGQMGGQYLIFAATVVVEGQIYVVVRFDPKQRAVNTYYDCENIPYIGAMSFFKNGETTSDSFEYVADFNGLNEDGETEITWPCTKDWFDAYVGTMAPTTASKDAKRHLFIYQAKEVSELAEMFPGDNFFLLNLKIGNVFGGGHLDAIIHVVAVLQPKNDKYTEESEFEAWFAGIEPKALGVNTGNAKNGLKEKLKVLFGKSGQVDTLHFDFEDKQPKIELVRQVLMRMGAGHEVSFAPNKKS